MLIFSLVHCLCFVVVSCRSFCSTGSGVATTCTVGIFLQKFPDNFEHSREVVSEPRVLFVQPVFMIVIQETIVLVVRQR